MLHRVSPVNDPVDTERDAVAICQVCMATFLQMFLVLTDRASTLLTDRCLSCMRAWHGFGMWVLYHKHFINGLSGHRWWTRRQARTASA